MMMDLASPVSAFVRERCQLGPDQSVARDLMYLTWKAWADANGHHAGAKITFGRSLHAAVPGLGRADIPVDGKRVHGYRGIGLLDGPSYRNNNADDLAHPARGAEPRGQSGFNDENHSAQTATASSAGNEPQAAAQDKVRQSRKSGATAQDAQDETQCRSNNGHQGPANPAKSERKTDESGPDCSGSAQSADCSGLREADTPNQFGDVDQQGQPSSDKRIDVCDFDALRFKLGLPTTQQTANGNGSTPNGQTGRNRPGRKPNWVTGICDHCDDRSGPPIIDRETGRCTKCWAYHEEVSR